jgi:hypothetical protein
MTNKTRKRVLRVPEKLPVINTYIFKEKEVDTSAEELKKQEDIKQRLERLQKFKEAEKKKLEEIEMLQKEQLQKLDNKIEDIKLYKQGNPEDVVYGAFLENQSEDGVQVKIYDSEPCETFEYNTADNSFQESLMDFFKDTPSVINEVVDNPLRKVEKIIMEEPKKITKPATPIDFTKNVKALIDERKNTINPQYTKPEIPTIVKPVQLIDQIIPHRNNTVVSASGRGRGPTSRTSSKLSDYKRNM